MSPAGKLHEQLFVSQFLAQFQFPAVAADHLVSIVIGIVLGHFPHRMGQTDSFSRTFAGGKSVEPLGHKFPIVAKTQHNAASFVYFSYYIASVQEEQGK
jgi:hypothetical protein